MKISPARLAAFEILRRIDTDHAFSSVLLPEYERDLSENDRALCHELVLGVLRRQIYLDRVIEHYARDRKLDTAVRIALRLGVYQLLFLDRVPAYSAINESVNLVHRAKKTSAKGLVNAVLRRVSETVPEFEYADEIERVSVTTSHPRWLVEKWIQDLGTESGIAVAAENNTVLRSAFRFTAVSSGPTEDFEKSEFVDGCYLAPSIDRRLRSLADAGEVYFQDEGSQLVGQVVIKETSGSFFDVCAAPGGKTSQIAGKLGSFAVAGDIHASRVHLLRATCERQGLGRVHVVQYDAEYGLPFADNSFDSVFVDAPCSGTGTIRHNPEIRYFLQRDDLPHLAKKQLAILRNASKLVRPGGRLIYSTCSLQFEENEAVCGEFEETAPGFRKITPRVPPRFVTEGNYVRTFPYRDGMDGFFIAVYERVSR